MFLEDFFKTKEGKDFSKLARESTTYNAGYVYWRDQLFERVMRLFVWENTFDSNNPKDKNNIEPKEIEEKLILHGHCGITRLTARTVKDELTAMRGTFYGVTKYEDDFTNYTVRCPIYSGSREIDKDVVVIRNNSLKNPVYPLIHRYATLLAHTEVTLVNTLVNARDNGGVPIAQTEKQKQSIQNYQGKLYNGQYGVVSDLGALGVTYAGTNRQTSQDIVSIMEVREKLIKSFYSDIGVRSAFEKRNNTVQAEVEADTSLLLLNLSDMIDFRKKGAEQVNKMFGTNWTVHIAKEIDYSVENERVAFGTDTEVHVKEEVKDDNS